MQAVFEERRDFIEKDKVNKYRENLLHLLRSENTDDNIEITLGGSVGLAIAPKEWNKSQVLNYLTHKKIYYFGDKYRIDGNDYPLINHPKVIGMKVDKYII